jgi:hypothetical protein
MPFNRKAFFISHKTWIIPEELCAGMIKSAREFIVQAEGYVKQASADKKNI